MWKSKIPTLAALLLLLLGLGLRLFDLTDQPIDFHPTRQLRGAIVARGMYYQMLPHADIATRQRAINFWQSTGDYEPPILERVVAITYLLVGGEYPWIARIYNSLFWILGGALLFALAKRASGPVSALVALAYYLVLPFSVQASRSFQPDPGMVVWMVLFAFAIYRWSEEWRSGHLQFSASSWKWAILAGLFAGLSVLTKAIAAYTIAVAAVIVVLYTAIYEGHQASTAAARGASILRIPLNIIRSPQIWAMALLMVVPSGLIYLTQGARASQYFSSWTLALSHLLLDPTLYLHWLYLVQSLMGWLPLLLAVLGIFLARPRLRALLAGLWGGYFVYGLFLPYQMYTHSYYHLQVIPFVALSLAPVAQFVWETLLRLASRHTTSATAESAKILSWSTWVLICLACLSVLTYFSWAALVPLRSRDYRDEPAQWQIIASNLPTDGKIIALTQDYGYRLMYYGWRKVILWPNRGEIKLSGMRGSEKVFETYFAKQTQNINYFLITSFRQFNDQPDLKAYLEDHYPILAQGTGYLIYDLTSPKN
jgi:4-amino-4-deoxy-L-arabinose transferase-like glycosyltransferase